MKIKKFNENMSIQDDDSSPVKVKDLIKYLQTLNPNANVILDKDDWGDESGDPIKIIKNSGLFEIFDGDLFINN